MRCIPWGGVNHHVPFFALRWRTFSLPKFAPPSCIPGDTTNVADKVLIFLLHLFRLRLVQILFLPPYLNILNILILNKTGI
jgi:hypothetical protein